MGTPWNSSSTPRPVLSDKEHAMTHRLVFVFSAALLFVGLATANKKENATTGKMPRDADGHPELNGIWAYAIDLPPVILKKEINGKVSITEIDHSAARPAQKPVPGALPSTPAPSYKPEFREK